MRTLIYYQKGNKRSQAVTQALQSGIARLQGDEHVLMIDEATYIQPLQADVVCFYGLAGNLMRLFRDYRRVGVETVFVDLGVWGRKGEPEPDFHRVAVNGYQPTPYFQSGYDPIRFANFRKSISPWQYTGDEVLIAGMSERASQVWGLGSATEHASMLVNMVRQYTDRPIAYRSKPSWEEAVAIPGTRYAMGPLDDELKRAWCTVSYRSNVAVDGLICGVPCFILGDHPALTLSHQGTESTPYWGITTLTPNDLSRIEDPYRPDDPTRFEFCASLAWHQYSLREFRSGYAWKELRKHGWLKS